MISPVLVARVHKRLTLPDGSSPLMILCRCHADCGRRGCQWERSHCAFCETTGFRSEPPDSIAVLAAVRRRGWHYKLVSFGHTSHICAEVFDPGLKEIAHADGETETEAIYQAVGKALEHEAKP